MGLYGKLYRRTWNQREREGQGSIRNALKTENRIEKVLELNLNDWKEFKIGNLFDLYNGKGITQEEIDDNQGTLNVVQSGEENNGILGYINFNYVKEMNYTYSLSPCLTVARTGSAGYVSFQRNGCVVGDSAKILLLKKNNILIEHYLFVQAVMSKLRYKYSYGRKVTEDKYLNETIKLPIQRDKNHEPIIDETKKYSDRGYIPDWNFMKSYINSLPYGDKIWCLMHADHITPWSKGGKTVPENCQMLCRDYLFLFNYWLSISSCFIWLIQSASSSSLEWSSFHDDDAT